MIYSSDFDKIPFHNPAKQRLRQTYAVLYFLSNGASRRDAIFKASGCFAQIHDKSQTIESKISTQIKVPLGTFFGWYDKGTLLSELAKRLKLNEHDYNIFSDLLKANVLALLPLPEEIDNISKPLFEGAIKKIAINAYERNPEARNICIKHYGSICFICKFSFERKYGTAGKGYIHVHHLRLLSEVRDNYIVNPIEDLRPVCPNCHAMIHSRTPPYSIEEMMAMLKCDT